MSIMYYEYKENQLALNIKCLWYVELKNLGLKPWHKKLGFYF